MLAAINRSFDRSGSGGSRGISNGLQFFWLDNPAGNDTLHVLGNERAAGQIHRSRIIPERIKLFLHPGNRFKVGVFPQQLVIYLPGRGALVDAAEKGGGRAVRISHNSGLAVDQAECGIGQYPHFDFLAGERFIEGTITRDGNRWGFFRPAGTPASAECSLSGGSGDKVLRVKVRVADDPHRSGYIRDGFPGNLEQAGAEITGDAVVGDSTFRR